MIDEAPAHNFNYVSARAPSDEQILVIEAIKRKDSTPGCKIISIENCVLYSEEYDEDDFPYVVFRWAEPLQGFYGRSAVTDSLGYQIRQNQLNENIWWGQNVACVPRLLVEQGSGIQPHKLTNEIGQVITYRGTPPMQLEWRAFPTELYNERERNKQACLSNLGLNERMTSGGMPSQFRADSSEAIRELNATDDDRFNDKVQEIEQVYIKVARKIVKAAAKLYRNKKVDRTTVYRSGQLVKQIKWSEVDEVGDKYVLQIAASSTLNMTPSARKDLLSKWADQGKITQGQYHHWVEAPDLERIDELNGASCAHIEYMTDKMLNGDWVPPDPHDDLGYGIPQVVKTYLYLRTLDCPEKILRLFRNWLVIAENLVNPEEAIPPPPPPGMQPPMPMPGDQGTIPPGPGMEFPQAQSPMPMGAAPPVPMPQPPGVM
jgi:hypothetical protein